MRAFAWGLLSFCFAKQREKHGADLAAWVRSRRNVLDSSTLEGDSSSAGYYECPVAGEAYSAAYLCDRKTFLKKVMPEMRLYKGQGNMEGASHAMFQRQILHKTVDLFDFFIEHLSWYERRFLRDADLLRNRTFARLGAQRFHTRAALADPSGVRRNDVVALMPFYATAGGGDAGHSAHSSRRTYLKITFESIERVFPNVVVCVATQPDEQFVKNASGLPFFDVLARLDLDKPSRLGFATVHLAQRAMIENPRWRKFNYVFYTESDQILHVRDINRLLGLANGSSTFVLPHRVMPVPLRADMGPARLPFPAPAALAGVFSKKPQPGVATLREFARNGAKTLHRIGDVSRVSCCFDRAPCSEHRGHWKKFQDPSVELFQLADAPAPSTADSFALLAGEGNFLRQSFRVCRLHLGERIMCRD